MARHLAFVEFADAAGIAYIVGAMITVAILAVLWLFVAFIGGTLGRIPLIGGPIKSAFSAAARWIRSAMMVTLHGTLWAAEKLFQANVAFLRNMFGIVRNAADALGGALEHTVNVIIPREVQTLRNRIDQVKRNLLFEIVALWHRTVQRIDLVRTELRAEIAKVQRMVLARIDQVNRELRTSLKALNASLRARIDQVDRALRADLSKAVSELRSLIQTRFTAAEALARQLFTRAEADIAEAEADAKAYADTVGVATFHKALTAVDSEAHQAEAGVWPEVTAMIGTLEKTAGNDFPELTKLLQQIPTNVPADLTAAIAASVRFMPPVIRTMTDCVLPDCRDLGPTRQWLHDMQLPATSIALLAWFIQMVTEPQTWADETYAFLNPLIDGELGAMRAFLGV
jgi:hypothetical protein